MDSVETLDLNARYSVEGYRGIAFYLIGYKLAQADCQGHPAEDCGPDGEYYPIGTTLYCDGECEPDPVTDDTTVEAVMVGDDRVHEIDVCDLTKLDDEDYCSCCGQIGCGWG